VEESHWSLNSGATPESIKYSVCARLKQGHWSENTFNTISHNLFITEASNHRKTYLRLKKKKKELMETAPPETEKKEKLSV